MSITEKLLYRDTYNFFLKNIKIILLLVIFSSLVTTIVNHIIQRNITVFSIRNLKNKNINFNTFSNDKNIIHSEKKKKILQVLFTKFVTYLFGKTLLFSSLILFMNNIKNKKKINILYFITEIIIIYPHLLTLLFFFNILIQLGTLLFVFPGTIISIFFSLSPIILVIEKKTAIDSVYQSIFMIKNKVQIIILAIFIYDICKSFIPIIFNQCNMLPKDISFFLVTIIINFFSSILLLYLFNFYMLIKNKKFSG